jgi:hypothetical protein
VTGPLFLCPFKFQREIVSDYFYAFSDAASISEHTVSNSRLTGEY